MERLKSEPSPSGCAAPGFTCCQQLCQLSACGTSEQVTGAPVAGADPGLAAVGFAGVCMWRQGWGLV